MRTCSKLPIALLVGVAGVALMAGCQRNPVPPSTTTTGVTKAAEAVNANISVAGPVELKDITETTPAYIIGISYPQAAAKYPPLAQALQDYAAAMQDQLMQAVGTLKGRRPAMPFDLSLLFSTVVETPRVVAVSAIGSSYLGGAHGVPLEQRFVWLPQLQQMLAAEQLIPDAAYWQPVSEYVRNQLRTQLQQQLDEDALGGDARSEQLQLRSQMISAGTAPKVSNFTRFEPVMNADGSIRALRFVFPPDQVAPYVEGTQTVEVPAKLLLPLVSAAYRPLFRAG